jgi:hypothetical protein
MWELKGLSGVQGWAGGKHPHFYCHAICLTLRFERKYNITIFKDGIYIYVTCTLIYVQLNFSNYIIKALHHILGWKRAFQE